MAICRDSFEIGVGVGVESRERASGSLEVSR